MACTTRQEIIGTIDYWRDTDKTVYNRIMEKYNDINVNDSSWYEFIIDEYTSALEAIGFSGVEISFSGFWCQGDGASFTGKYSHIPGQSMPINLNSPALYNLVATIQEIGANHEFYLSVFRNSYRYSHKNTDSIGEPEFLARNGEILYFNPEHIVDTIESDCKDIMQDIYKYLEEAYMEYTSENSVYEALLTNDYYFNSKGEICQ